MDDMPLLRVIIGKTVIYGSIPSAFVSIAPKEDARMIDISGYHFRKQACGNAIAITVLPASQFVHIKQAQRVAKLQEMLVGRIVRTYGIHVHLFDKAGILQVELPTYATSGFRVETMPIGTFQFCFQINRPVDTPEEPPVRPAFGCIDRLVIRLFLDRYFQLVLRPEAQQIRNVIRETVETSLMDRPCRLAIDFYLRIGHHTFENDAHLFVFPRFRYPEIMPVDAIFIVEIVLAISIVLLFAFTLLINIVASVGIATESLLFPTGGYFDGAPFSTVHSFRTPEVPRYGMFRIRSGEILHFGLLRPCRE